MTNLHGERAPLRTALILTALIAVLELTGGIYAHSLALVADSAHVFMDVLALGISVYAGAQALRPANMRQSFGFARMEILAALLNGGLLFAVTALIVVEAVRRFAAPELPQGGIMLGVALVGIVVNVGLGVALARTAGDNLNVRAAMLHVASDAHGIAQARAYARPSTAMALGARAPASCIRSSSPTSWSWTSPCPAWAVSRLCGA